MKIGRRGEGHTEIVSGLEAGEEIVTSATFLIDAESNLKRRFRPSARRAEMIAAVIRWSARNVFLVGLADLFVTVLGIYAVYRVPLDAIPDLSDAQVIIYTEFPARRRKSSRIRSPIRSRRQC